MSIPAWQVTSWSTIFSNVRDWEKSVKKLRHLGTTSHEDPSAGGLRYGQVVWGFETDGRMVGIAWDWREVKPGIVAMADPMSVLSNVALLDERKDRISASASVVHLNTAIYHLPWQRQVCESGESIEPWREPLAMAA